VSVVAPSQTASYLWVPPHSTSTAGGEVGEMARRLGFDVDAPEQEALDVLMAESGDRWAALEAAIICGRQNLKTWALEMTVLYDAFFRDVKRVTWSSHRFKTTQQAFNDLETVIGNTDWLRSRTRKVRHSSGDEGFELVNGARIDFLARTSGGGRGLTGDTVILDEALYLTTAMMGALLPTLSARPDPHVRYGSSPGVLESDALRAIRNRGRALDDPSLAYIEWTSERADCADPDCAHGLNAEGCLLDDEERWARANPALGRRISVEYVRQERRALAADPVEFMRERMGWWEDPPADGSGVVFPTEDWTACRDTVSSIADDAPLSWSIDLSFDRSAAHVVAFGAGPDGLPHGVLRHTCDPSDVVAYLVTATAERPSLGIAVQGNGAPASSLIPDLERELSIPVVPISGADVARACGYAHDAVTSHRVRHRGQSQIDRALAVAEVRSLSDGWALDRKRSRLDIAPLVAWVNGLWLYQTFEAEPDPVGFFITT
jgi:hypothetical protein